MSSPVLAPRPRRSLAGPIVLIVIGVLFLLRNVGVHIPLFRLFAHWWPLLLIIWGVVKLVEHYQAKREGTVPARIGFGGALLVFFIIAGGLAVTGLDRAKDQINWGEVRDEMNVDEDFINMFGSTYTYDDQIEKDIPVADMLRIVSDRGNLTINAWDQSKIKIVVHKRVFGSNPQEAQNVNTGTVPQVEVNGTMVVVNANTQGAGNKGVSTDMEIYVPRKLALDIAGRRGDVNVSGRDGDLKIATSRGDVMVEDIGGSVNLNLRKGSLRASRVKGNVTADGRFDDTLLVDIGGAAVLNGEFFGDLKLSKIAKGVTFHSSRTDLEFARLDGNLDLDQGDLRATQILGPVRLLTRSKDIHLEDVTGDVRIENSNGSVELHPNDKQPLGNIEINANRGDVRLMMPAKAGFQMQAQTRHGEVQSDFSELKIDSQHGKSTVTGNVGKTGSKVQVTSDSGDIEIRKTAG
ncbi:MAG TPA: DUF4097 family beta strand repeat-containing protein [Clostridia bacterium]|nr:DUF4097 family beta strand repeat-containing protein [Clostridia bacterium]